MTIYILTFHQQEVNNSEDAIPAWAITITGVFPELVSSSTSFCNATRSIRETSQGTVHMQLSGSPSYNENLWSVMKWKTNAGFYGSNSLIMKPIKSHNQKLVQINESFIKDYQTNFSYTMKTWRRITWLLLFVI